MKTFISYVPHGINQNFFYPIDQAHDKYQELLAFKEALLHKRSYDFVLLFNSRNIRRKSIPDTLLAFKLFLENLSPEAAKKCCIVLHTQPVDDNGTDLYAVRDMLFGEAGEHHVIFSENRGDLNFMNLLYNSCDGVILLSSNEGWGLSITEALMCGKPVIGNVTGGIQDQARFQDAEGNWLDFTDTYMSNSVGNYKEHGSWFYPVYPSNISIQGSPLTPYIHDERVDARDAAKVILDLYSHSSRAQYGLEGREWILSDESGMTATKMCDNVIGSIDHLFANWEPREAYEVIKIDKPRKKKHVKSPISR